MKKVLMIIGGIVLAIAVLGGIIFAVISLTSSKMKCTSSNGNITIMYNDERITGYSASGMSFDLDAQNIYAKQMGIEAYLDEFEDWFVDNTGGTCSR